MKQLAFCKFIPQFISILLATGSIVISTSIAGTEPPSLTTPKSINLGGTIYSRENYQWHQTRYSLYRQTIENELKKKPLPAWAGKWGESNLFTSNEFLVSPSGLFVRNKLSDVGNGDWEYGTAQLISGQFLLRLAPGIDDYLGRGFIPGPYLVIWDDVRFIIEPQNMLDFVNRVNAHTSPQTICGYGTSCVGYVDSKTLQTTPPSKTRPQLPPPWNAFLLKEPVTAKILSQYHYTTVIHEKNKTIKTRFTIDHGASSRLKPGMTMHFTSKYLSPWESTVTVETVSNNSAVVEFSDTADLNSAKKLHQYNPPRVGQTLSTHDISEVELENYIKKINQQPGKRPQPSPSPNK